MSKARTKAKKLADKRRMQLAGLPELAAIPRRQEQAREGGRFVRTQEDPRKVALNSRCARFGIEANRRNRTIVSAQHMCCDMGFVIEAKCGSAEVARLWDVFHRWTRAEVTYRTRYLGQGETPASAALMMIHDRIETDQSLSVDVRTPDERDRDAVSGWMRWQGFLGHLDADPRSLLQFARLGYGPVLWWEGKPTPNGLIALEGLRKLAHISERKGH